MKFAPSYFSRKKNFQTSPSNSEMRDLAVDAYRQGRFAESIEYTLKSINTDAESRGKKNQNPLQYTFKHGSVNVSLSVTPEEFIIESAFLKIPDTPSPALLRQIAEINFNELGLAHFNLNGKEIRIGYRDRIEHCHPSKIYDLLAEICFCSDFYDDIFIEKFKAERLETFTSNPPSEATLEQKWEAYRQILTETNEIIKFFEEKRWISAMYDPISLAYHRILYCINPSGFLFSEIRRCISEMRQQESQEIMIQKAKKNLEKLSALPKEKFRESLYSSEYLLSRQRILSLEQVQDFLGGVLNQSADLFNSEVYIGSSLSALESIYRFLCSYRAPEAIDVFLETLLSRSNRQEWKSCAEVICNELYALLKGIEAKLDELHKFENKVA